MVTEGDRSIIADASPLIALGIIYESAEKVARRG